MSRLAATVLLLLSFACASPKAAAGGASPPSPAASLPEQPPQQQKLFHVPLPGKDWRAIPGGRLGDGPPAMVALYNEKTNALIRFEAVPAKVGSPAMIALNASDALESRGVRTSNIDFSDPTGDRVSFTFVSETAETAINGKVAVFRLAADESVVFAATGIWPPSSNDEMTTAFDATVAAANIR